MCMALYTGIAKDSFISGAQMEYTYTLGICIQAGMTPSVKST